jgi:hypothetical protein
LFNALFDEPFSESFSSLHPERGAACDSRDRDSGVPEAFSETCSEPFSESFNALFDEPLSESFSSLPQGVVQRVISKKETLVYLNHLVNHLVNRSLLFPRAWCSV